MKLRVVGCSPAWPNPGGAHSGYLFEHSGRRLLVDCGPGVLSRLREDEPWPIVAAIAITHLHLDHCGDLVPWLWGHLVGPAAGAPSPELWLPPGGRGELERLASGFDDAFSVHEYGDRDPFAAAGFRITPYAVAHGSTSAFGLRLEAGGKVAALSSDTGPTRALAELARDADVFLCEATLDEPDSDPRTHLTAREAAAAALQANARRLLLVHRPAELPPPHGLEVARDGLTLDL